MTHIPDDFDAFVSPYIQLGKRTVHLDGGDIEINGRQKGAFTVPELTLFLRLLEKAYTAPRGYLPTWHLAQCIYSYPTINDMDDANHAVEQHIYKMRRKLGESRYKPRYLIGGRNKGYKLCIPKGSSNAPLRVLRKLLDMLNFR